MLLVEWMVLVSLEIDSPSRGRKLEYNPNEPAYDSLEIDSPSRGRKLQYSLMEVSLPTSSLEIDSPSRGRKLNQNTTSDTSMKFRN